MTVGHFGPGIYDPEEMEERLHGHILVRDEGRRTMTRPMPTVVSLSSWRTWTAHQPPLSAGSAWASVLGDRPASRRRVK